MYDLVGELYQVQQTIELTEYGIEQLKFDIGTEHQYFIDRAQEELDHEIHHGENDEDINQYYIDEIKEHKEGIKHIKQQISILQKNLKRLNLTREELIIKLAKDQSHGFGRKGIKALTKKLLRSSTTSASRFAQGRLRDIERRSLNLGGYVNQTMINQQTRELTRIRDNVQNAVISKQRLAIKLAKKANKELARGNRGLSLQLRRKAELANATAQNHNKHSIIIDERLDQLIARSQGVEPYSRKFRYDWI